MAFTIADQDLGRTLDRRTVSSIGDRKALSALPTIDISPFRRSGSSAEQETVARQARDACIDLGFFYLQGHGFDHDELNEALEWSNRFFKLPFQDKMRVAAQNAMGVGFIPAGGVGAVVKAIKNADRKERFYIGRELDEAEIRDAHSAAGWSQWPDDKILPGFKTRIKAITQRKVELAYQISRMLSLSLGLPEEALSLFHHRMGCIHSLNYYPASQENNDVWGFSPHTDYGSFTILHQDDGSGLQAQNAAGEWIDVPPVKGALIVNIGDLMARWTNDLSVSALHRVISRSDDARFSASFFAYPNPLLLIECLPTCTSPENPARYQPVVAGDYIRDLLGQALRTGRAGVSQETAHRLGSNS